MSLVKASMCVAGMAIVSVPTFAQEAAKEEVKAEVQAATQTAKPFRYAVSPEGKTLPQNMMRIRFPYATTTSKSGFDKDGKKSESGFTLQATGGAFVVEYGLTEKVSIQVLSRYVQKLDIAIDNNQFKKTSTFSSLKQGTYLSTFSNGVQDSSSASNLIIGGIAKSLAAQGACNGATTAADCVTQISNGFKAPAEIDGAALKLTGLKIPKDTEIKGAVNSYVALVDAKIENGILTGAKGKEVHGAKGMGDTEIGALYSALATDNMWAAVAGGIRLPTGKCKKLGDAEIPSGRCVTEAAVRLNFDYMPLDSMMVSIQNQSEVMLAKGKQDGGDSQVDVKRKGVRNIGFIYLKGALDGAHPSLNVLAPKVGITYDYDSGKVVDGVGAPRESQINSYAGLGFDLTRYQFPVQIDLEYAQPYKGRDKTFATTTSTTTLKLFAKF